MMSRRQSEKGPVAATFWGLFVLACLVAVGVLSIQGGEMAGGALAVLIFLPAVQLGALVLTAVAIFMFPATFADRRASLRSLGAIGSWSFGGAVLGVVAMVLIGTASR